MLHPPAAGDQGALTYELPTSSGVLRLLRKQHRWVVTFDGGESPPWRSAEAAALAAARHRSGLVAWDETGTEVSDDLLDWRPLGESL
jgi:hypothetical protein